jgi:hypothetical protein
MQKETSSQLLHVRSEWFSKQYAIHLFAGLQYASYINYSPKSIVTVTAIRYCPHGADLNQIGAIWMGGFGASQATIMWQLAIWMPTKLLSQAPLSQSVLG